jgi:hypothetical protein
MPSQFVYSRAALAMTPTMRAGDRRRNSQAMHTTRLRATEVVSTPIQMLRRGMSIPRMAPAARRAVYRGVDVPRRGGSPTLNTKP